MGAFAEAGNGSLALSGGPRTRAKSGRNRCAGRCRSDVAPVLADVGARPWGIDVSPDAGFLFTANGPSNDVSVIDVEAAKETGSVKGGQSPWGVVVVPAAE